MWRKATAAAVLALAVGYLYHGSPELPEQILQYINLPNLQSFTQSQASVEQVISAAWDTLISLPTRQWSRVAVGWVLCVLSLRLYSCSRVMVLSIGMLRGSGELTHREGVSPQLWPEDEASVKWSLYFT